MSHNYIGLASARQLDTTLGRSSAYGYGLYSYGLYSCGLYSYGLNNQLDSALGRHRIVVRPEHTQRSESRLSGKRAGDRPLLHEVACGL